MWDLLTIDVNSASVGVMCASDYLDQRGFSCTVLTKQRMDLSWPQIKRNTLERANGTKGLRDGFELKERRHWIRES